MAGDERVEPASEELYGLPLADFTGARDELARRLRREDRRDEADAVKALRKPTIAAWALNQLARRRPKDVERLLATGERLREAQEALLAGGDRSALQRASTEERELVAKLTQDATALAGEARTGATASLGERIASTLHAAALDEETAAELAAGRLVREREAVGLFGAAVEVGPARRTGSPAGPRAPAADSAAAAPQPGRRGRPRDAAPGKRRGAGGASARQAADERAREAAERRREAERELAAARAEERKASREQAAARKATERADKRVQGAERRADDARAQADEARAGLRDAKRREREAAKSLERAARAVATAEKKLG